MKKNKLIIILWFMFLLILPKKQVEPVENKSVEAGVAFDVANNSDNNKNFIYKVTRNMYVYAANDKIFSENFSGIGYSIGETRENRNTKNVKETIQGMEELYLLSEKQAEIGIKDVIDILFRNPYLSDTGVLVICKGYGEDLLKLKIPGHTSAVEYIHGIIENSDANNFFSSDYSMSDLYPQMGGEGRNVVVPYIGIIEQKPYVCGSVFILNDRMQGKLDIDETRTMNMIRGNNVKGILSIVNNSKEYIDFYCTSKKKVKCKKENGRYKFEINLKLSGDVINNELFDDMIKDPEVVKTFENKLAKQVEKQCYDFINKMQNVYKVDWIELGKYAVAKSGRRSSIDWNNEIVNNSDIEVNVKVNVNQHGRGNY